MARIPLLALLTILAFINQVQGKCIWYGECGASGQGGDGKYNCKYTGDPVLQTNETFLSFYKELCPHLFVPDEQGHVSTCCDYAQLVRYNKQLAVPRQLMTRCPACWLNFRTFLCDFTCGPNQADYMLIDEESKFNDTTDQVVSLTYYITNSSADNMYNSCVDVQYAASNGKIMDLLCGTTVDNCSPYAFISYLGNNPLAPFVFHMNMTNETFNYNDTVTVKPANSTMHSCSQSFTTEWVNGTACGCSDCVESCPVPPPPPSQSDCKIWGIDCVTFVSSLLFIVFVVVFTITVLIGTLMRRRAGNESSNQQEATESKKPGLGKLAELMFTKIFQK